MADRMGLMSDDRKDEGGLAVFVAAGCLVVAIGVFTLIGYSLIMEYRNRLAQQRMQLARQQAAALAIQARQQADLAAAAAKLAAADEEAAVSESK